MITNNFKVIIADTAKDAPNYGGDFTAVKITKCVIVKKGTEMGNPTVDMQLEDANGNKFVVMTTGNLLNTLAATVEAACNVAKRTTH